MDLHVSLAGPGDRASRIYRELLEAILAHDDGLLGAIADGTFGLMKRPADRGRGLDGVARRSAAYVNPATDLLQGE